jgi:hypothetical protein
MRPHRTMRGHVDRRDCARARAAPALDRARHPGPHRVVPRGRLRLGLQLRPAGQPGPRDRAGPGLEAARSPCGCRAGDGGDRGEPDLHRRRAHTPSVRWQPGRPAVRLDDGRDREVEPPAAPRGSAAIAAGRSGPICRAERRLLRHAGLPARDPALHSGSALRDTRASRVARQPRCRSRGSCPATAPTARSPSGPTGTAGRRSSSTGCATRRCRR